MRNECIIQYDVELPVMLITMLIVKFCSDGSYWNISDALRRHYCMKRKSNRVFLFLSNEMRMLVQKYRAVEKCRDPSVDATHARRLTQQEEEGHSATSTRSSSLCNDVKQLVTGLTLDRHLNAYGLQTDTSTTDRQMTPKIYRMLRSGPMATRNLNEEKPFVTHNTYSNT
jgi:hypothetical protein